MGRSLWDEIKSNQLQYIEMKSIRLRAFRLFSCWSNLQIAFKFANGFCLTKKKVQCLSIYALKCSKNLKLFTSHKNIKVHNIYNLEQCVYKVPNYTILYFFKKRIMT